MRAPDEVDDGVVAPAGESRRSDVVQTISDETTERVFRGVMILMGVVVVIGLFAAAAIWALQGDDPPPTPMNEVDVGFLQDMLDHHEQALLISNIYLENQPDDPVAPYANEVILFQTREIEWMINWLAEEGYEPGAPDRMAMAWMDDPVPVAQMPGMQSEERLDQLRNATGAEADRLWFDIMTDHHLGGVHMAEFAAANGARVEVVEFAEAVARNQTIEVNEYNAAIRRLGLD
jgi:uncharacterized protein (DUF305 family)